MSILLSLPVKGPASTSVTTGLADYMLWSRRRLDSWTPHLDQALRATGAWFFPLYREHSPVLDLGRRKTCWRRHIEPVCLWDSPGKSTGVGAIANLDLPNPGIEPRVSHTTDRFFTL